MVEWTSHWTLSLPADYNYDSFGKLANGPTKYPTIHSITAKLWNLLKPLMFLQGTADWVIPSLEPHYLQIESFFFFSYFSSPPSSCQKTPCSVEKNWFPWHPDSVNVDHQHPHNVPLLSVFNCILSFKRVSGHWLYFQGGKKPNRNWDSLKYRPEGTSYGQIPSLQGCLWVTDFRQ